MNLQRINEIRENMGLPPVSGDPRKQERARRRNANLAARAEESRRLKSLRSGPAKGKR